MHVLLARERVTVSCRQLEVQIRRLAIRRDYMDAARDVLAVALEYFAARRARLPSRFTLLIVTLRTSSTASGPGVDYWAHFYIERDVKMGGRRSLSTQV